MQAELHLAKAANERGSRHEIEGHIMSRKTGILGAVFAATVLATAQAVPAKTVENTGQARIIQVKASAGFSWFSNGKSATEARVAQANLRGRHSGRSLGHGSWICSPAGFGKKSSCIAR